MLSYCHESEVKDLMELLETILVILNIGAIGACLVTVWFNIKIMELQNELNKHDFFKCPPSRNKGT